MNELRQLREAYHDARRAEAGLRLVIAEGGHRSSSTRLSRSLQYAYTKTRSARLALGEAIALAENLEAGVL